MDSSYVAGYPFATRGFLYGGSPQRRSCPVPSSPKLPLSLSSPLPSTALREGEQSSRQFILGGFLWLYFRVEILRRHALRLFRGLCPRALEHRYHARLGSGDGVSRGGRFVGAAFFVCALGGEPRELAPLVAPLEASFRLCCVETSIFFIGNVQQQRLNK